MSLTYEVVVTHDKVVVSWARENDGGIASQLAEDMGVCAAKAFGMNKLESSSFGTVGCSMTWVKTPAKRCRHGHGSEEDHKRGIPESCLCAPSCGCKDGPCRLPPPSPRVLTVLDGALMLKSVADAVEVHGEFRKDAINKLRFIADKMIQGEEAKS